MQLHLQYIACARQPVLAGDPVAWPRPTAYTLQDRAVEHPPDPVPGGPPITLGHGVSTLGWVPEPKGCWAFPILHGRITSQEIPFGPPPVCQGRGR